MKKFINSFTFIALLSIGLISCQKENIDPIKQDGLNFKDEEGDKVGKEAFFLAGKDCKSYQVERFFINDTDLTATVPSCYLDNILTFCRNGRYEDAEGLTKCAPNLPDIYNFGTYTFNDDYTKFTVTSANLNGEFTIVELKPNMLKAYFYDANLNNVKTEFWLKPYKSN